MAAKTKKVTAKKQANKVSPKKVVEAKKNDKVTVAKTSDGTVQITFVFPWVKIENDFYKNLDSLGKDVEVPGFRKGKAPREKILAKIDPHTLIERTLQGILPEAFANAIRSEKIIPAMYPKFEILNSEMEHDWSVRAITCEMPEIKLNKYKEVVKGAVGKANIVTPDTKDKVLTKEEKEQIALSAVMEEAKVEIPKLLVTEEADNKLAQLLERLEKLGLTLDKYLESIKKSAEDLRADYAKQASETIKMELVLLKVAEEEKIEVKETEVDEFIKAAQGDPNLSSSLDNPEQKQIIKSILKKRKAIDKLVSFT